MQDLIQQEIFELEVLNRLNSARLLTRLFFGGGTMLRLCHGLERFSVDLDFWLKGLPSNDLFERFRACLGGAYSLADAADKYHTWLFELKSKAYPRALKIEIRKDVGDFTFRTEQNIAFSRYTPLQVLVTAISLPDMAAAKVRAFLQRGEIRDVYDLEFLCKRGIIPEISPADRKELLAGIDALTRHDYQVKLGSLIEEPLRTYYRQENFKILKAKLTTG